MQTRRKIAYILISGLIPVTVLLYGKNLTYGGRVNQTQAIVNGRKFVHPNPFELSSKKSTDRPTALEVPVENNLGHKGPIGVPLIFSSTYISLKEAKEERLSDKIGSVLIIRRPHATKRHVILNQDPKNETHQIWPENGPNGPNGPNSDNSCANFYTRFVIPESLPPTALASYPGSGNTWLRYLIEGATGLFTGSLYRDKHLLAAGHLGEARQRLDGTTVVQKTHHVSFEKFLPTTTKRITYIQKYGNRAILVIRNPFEAIWSFWNYEHVGKNHTKIVPEIPTPKNKMLWREYWRFVRKGASRWSVLYMDYLRHGQEVLLLFYEDLVRQPISELQTILAFLSLDYPSEAEVKSRLTCIQNHLTGQFRRSQNKRTVEPSRAMVKEINAAILKVNSTLTELLGPYRVSLDMYLRK